MYANRVAVRIISTNASGSLNSNVATSNTIIDTHANVLTQASSVDLSITSVGGNPTPTAVNLKMLGTLNDFFGVLGCSLTIHGLLVVRPV